MITIIQKKEYAKNSNIGELTDLLEKSENWERQGSHTNPLYKREKMRSTKPTTHVFPFIVLVLGI